MNIYNWQRLLTAQLLGPPVEGFPTSVDTLSGKLRHCVAQAERICAAALATVAEVCNTGRGEGLDVQQAVTAVEGWPCEDLLTQRFLQNRWTDRQERKQFICQAKL